ncbi:MAG: hypothetical protein LBL44_12025 [Treponema sp.]|nr:hypothetical protein [Treponema sp.]
MEVSRPLRVILLVYEIIRLFVLTALGVFLAPPLSFPWPVYAVSNSFFLLITLFLLARVAVYRAYLPLYIAGKAAAIAASLGWCFFTGNDIAALVIINPQSVLVTLGTLGLFLVGDILSASGAFWLHARLREADADAGAPAGFKTPEEGGL